MKCILCYKDTDKPVNGGFGRSGMLRKRFRLLEIDGEFKSPEEAELYVAQVLTRYLRIFGPREVYWKLEK